VPLPCEPTARRLILWFTRLNNKTDQAVVTGVKAAAGEPIVITGCAEPDAQGYCQGKVEFGLSMPWERTTGVTGGEVVKTITGDGALGVGYVVEGVRGTGLVSASGSQSLSGGYSAGLVTLSGLDPSQITRKVDVALVALDGAAESLYEDIVPYIGLVAGRDNSFVGKVRVPALSMTAPRLRLVLWFAMPTAGTPPSTITVSYARVSAADLVGDSSSSLQGGGFNVLPAEWSDETELNLDHLGNLGVGEYFARRAIDLGVLTDELFFFRVRRSSTGGYSGELGVINMYATIYDNG
jgi:hypothetical protein